MNYKQSLDFLYSSLPMYQRMGAAAYKNNLETSLEFDRIHGHPHRSYKCIHIAGTNGKGSVSHMIASILQSGGFKTGLYTSPHLKDFRERIRIDGKPVAEDDVVKYLDKNKRTIEKLKPSFFEMTVDMAFLYFQKEEVDVAVIETGMGGRLDSTNIIEPEVSVITNIGLDHTRFLGETLQEIAGEKAGIIKKEVPVVIGEYHPDTYPVFKKKAKEQRSEINVADRNFNVELMQMNLDRSINMKVKDNYNSRVIDIQSDLAGAYQKKNILTVLETMAVLSDYGWQIDDKDILSGLSAVQKNTGLRGRWEEIGYNPLVIADTAHNAEGVTEVTAQLKTLPYKNLHIVWAMVSDKNPQKILRLLPAEAKYYFTKADIPRSMNERILSEMALEFGLKGQSFSNSIEALLDAKKNALAEDVIFIGGSTFLVGEVI